MPEEIDQLVTSLPKLKDLNLNPISHIKQLGKVAHVYSSDQKRQRQLDLQSLLAT